MLATAFYCWSTITLSSGASRLKGINYADRGFLEHYEHGAKRRALLGNISRPIILRLR